MKKAFSYLRMSTESQLKGDSRRRQLEKSKKYAKEHGYEFVESLEDIGVSAYKGKNIREGALGRFRDALESGDVNPNESVLLIESLDRLTRESFGDAFEEFNRFLKTGITIVTIIDGQVYTRESLNDHGRIFTAVGVLLRAHDESRTKSIRLKESWKEKRRNIGKTKLTSVAPAWLRLKSDKSEFEEIPERARIVREIFDLCIDEGMGTYSIARLFNENIDSYPKFTLPMKRNRLSNGQSRTGWQKSYITKILNNPAVHGFYQPNKMEDGKRVPEGKPIPNYFPEIVSKKRFELAQIRMKERKIGGSGRKGKGFSNLFTNLAVCKRCGDSITFRNKGKPPKGGKYLRCQSADLKNKCKSRAWRYDDFESNFIRHISEVRFDEVLLVGNEKSKITKLQEEMELLADRFEKQSADYEKGISNLVLIDPEFLKDAETEVRRIKQSLEATEKRLKEVKFELAELQNSISKKSHEEVMAELEMLVTSLSDEERGRLRRRIHNRIRTVISKIEIDAGPFPIYPWEVEDLVPTEMLRQLSDEEGKSVREIKSLFETDYGKRLYNETQRNFTVHYKSGGIATVMPYHQYKIKTDPRFRKRKSGSVIGDAE